MIYMTFVLGIVVGFAATVILHSSRVIQIPIRPIRKKPKNTFVSQRTITLDFNQFWDEVIRKNKELL